MGYELETLEISQGDSIEIAEQATLAFQAMRNDSLGADSPWDGVSLAGKSRQTQSFVRDAVAASRQDGLSVRTDAPGVPGLLAASLEDYDTDFLMDDYEETLYADPGFLTIEDRNRPGSPSTTVQSVSRTGRFKFGGDRTSNTEALDAGMRSTSYPAHFCYAHVTYTTEELYAMEEARRNGNVFGFMDIVRYKLTDIVEASYKEQLNRVNSVGAKELGIYGLHTHFGLPRAQSPIFLDENSTPDEYVTVIRALVKAMIDNSGKRLKGPDALIMPSDLKTEMQSRLIGTSGNASVLDWIMKSFNIKDVFCPPQADNSSGAGGSLIHGMINNPRHTKAIVLKKLTQEGQAYRQNGQYRVDFHAKMGGVVCKKPYEHMILEAVI